MIFVLSKNVAFLYFILIKLSTFVLPIIVFSENSGTQVLDFKTYHFGIKNALKVQLTG